MSPISQIHVYDFNTEEWASGKIFGNHTIKQVWTYVGNISPEKHNWPTLQN